MLTDGRNPNSFIYTNSADQLNYIRQAVETWHIGGELNPGMSSEAVVYVRHLWQLHNKVSQGLISTAEFIEALNLANPNRLATQKVGGE